MSKIASTYALALFDAAQEVNTLEITKTELNVFLNAILAEETYMSLLKHPKLSKADKLSLVEQALANNDSTLVLNFIKLLIDKERIGMLQDIVTAFNQRVNAHLSIVEGVVYSATVLTNEQVETLTHLFTKKLKMTVDLKVVIDTSLIGGYKVSVNNVVYDNSVKLQLKQLKETLMNVELN